MQQLGSHHWARSVGARRLLSVSRPIRCTKAFTYEQGVEVPLLDESADDHTVQECEDRTPSTMGMIRNAMPSGSASGSSLG